MVNVTHVVCACAKFQGPGMAAGILSHSKVNTHSLESYQCIWHRFRIPELPPIPTSRLKGFRYLLSREVRAKESVVECSYEADPVEKPICGRGQTLLQDAIVLGFAYEERGGQLPSQVPPCMCLYPHSVHSKWSARL